MKTITLKQLKLNNFKGIKNLTINFSTITNIAGDNGTGKTTIIDAFLWLLFDKDSTNRKDFQIKPLDKNNEAIHNLDYSVTALLVIDGKEIPIKKTYKEIWTKKHGHSEKLLTKHTNSFLVDDVPFNLSEFKGFVNDLIDERIFKIITNPFYFSNVLKWEDRRNILIDFADEINVGVSQYLKDLLEDKTEKQLKDSLNFKRKNLNKELEAIPTRIDEVFKSIVPIDNNKLAEKKQFEQDLKDCNDSLFGFADAHTKEKEELTFKRRDLNSIENETNKRNNEKLQELQTKLSSRNRKLNELKTGLENNELTLKSSSKTIVELDKLLNNLGNEFVAESKTVFVFDETLSICPTCKQSLQVEVIQDKKDYLKNNFNAEKATALKKINEKGKDFKERKESILISNESHVKAIAELKTEIEEHSQMIQIIEKDISKAENFEIKFPKEWEILKAETEELESKLTTADYSEQKEELNSKKDSIADELQVIRNIEKDIELNIKRSKRIEELEIEQTNISNQIAELEKGLFELETFTRAKSEALEQNINSKFSFVKFKLFETQINGGISETCTALINGVPFADANNASKYNAGLDIINTLSKHYEVTAPIFIDNREGINEIIDTDSQIINLIVNDSKELSINKLNEVA